MKLTAESMKKPHYRCPLCGKQFTYEEAEACLICPYASKCSLVMCPQCHYEFPNIDRR